MKKRVLLPLAIVTTLVAGPLPSTAGLGPTATVGRTTIQLCMLGCADPHVASITFTGTWVISGKVYAGDIIGIAPAHYGPDGASVIVDPFTVQGVSTLQQMITLNCEGLTFGNTAQFKIRCMGTLLNGPTGFRMVAVKATSGLGNNACSCDRRNIQGIYRGVTPPAA